MDNKKEKLSIQMQYDEKQTIPLALHEMHMARADRRQFWTNVGWAVSVILLIAINAWLWYQYDYESVTEYSGVYNLVDAEGNVVTSDISPDDVIRILEAMNHGEGEKAENP